MVSKEFAFFAIRNVNLLETLLKMRFIRLKSDNSWLFPGETYYSISTKIKTGQVNNSESWKTQFLAHLIMPS